MGNKEYTDAPADVELATEDNELIDPQNTGLPTPEEFRKMAEREKKQKVTILLDAEALGKFKKYAVENGMKYQSMINDVVATYAKKNLK